MKIIIKPRNKGKTTDLINIASEEFLYIVCFSYGETHRVADMAKRLNKDIPFPLTFNEFLEGRFSISNINGFLIDNCDHLLNTISLGVPVKAVTFLENSE